MRKITIACLWALSLLPGAAVAQQPDSLEALLAEVRSYEQRRAEVLAQRVQRFVEARDRQQSLLAQARGELEQARQRSERLKATFEEQRQRLDELEATLKQRSGNLGELFGSAREAASDFQSVLRDSPIRSQLGERFEQLQTLTDSQRQPSMDQLQAMWTGMLDFMVASGQVSRYTAPVLSPRGERQQRQVTRVGAFNAVAEGRYLNYDGQVGLFSELPRQPASRFVASAQALETAEQGPVGFGVDPTRGQLLAMLIQRPDWLERVQQGGLIGYVIIGLGLLGLLLALERMGYLAWVGRRMSRQAEAVDQPRADNPLGRVLAHYEANRLEDPETLELRIDEAVLKERPRLQRRVALIKLVASMAPLLGLLGTVTGMIQTFQDITLFGTGDPKLMADGISQALVTTALGLTVAVPLIFLHNLVHTRSTRLINMLEEQTAGLIAEHAEAQAEEREARAA